MDDMDGGRFKKNQGDGRKPRGRSGGAKNGKEKRVGNE